MVKNKKFLFFALLSSVCFLKGVYFLTDGFKLQKVAPKNHYKADWDSGYYDKEALFCVVSQPYFYLGKGRQAYVFESEDKRYVLKLVRYHKYKVPLWSYFLEKIPPLKSFTLQNLFEKEERIERAMSSYQIANEKLKQISGVLFIHLNKTNNLNKKIVIFDRARRRFKINLDDFVFLLQKKAFPLDKILTRVEEGKQKEIIDAFFEVVQERIDKGILNRDFVNCVRNTGVVGATTVIELDVGSFYEKKGFLAEEQFRLNLMPFRNYLQKKLPHMVSYLDEKMKAKGYEEIRQ